MKRERQSLTPLVFPKIHRLFQDQLISVHLGIEAVVRLQDDRQISRADVDRAPGSHGLSGVDVWLHVFEMSLSEALNRAALANSQYQYLKQGESELT